MLSNIIAASLLVGAAIAAPAGTGDYETLQKRSTCVFTTTSDCSIAVPGPAGGGGPLCQSGYGMTKDGVKLNLKQGGCEDKDCNYGQQFGFLYDGLPAYFLYSGQGDEAGCPSGCKGAYGDQTALKGKKFANALATHCGCSVTFSC